MEESSPHMAPARKPASSMEKVQLNLTKYLVETKGAAPAVRSGALRARGGAVRSLLAKRRHKKALERGRAGALLADALRLVKETNPERYVFRSLPEAERAPLQALHHLALKAARAAEEGQAAFDALRGEFEKLEAAHAALLATLRASETLLLNTLCEASAVPFTRGFRYLAQAPDSALVVAGAAAVEPSPVTGAVPPKRDSSRPADAVASRVRRAGRGR